MKRIAVWLLAVCLLCTLACVKEPDEPILQITAEETPAPVDDTPEETPAPEQTPEPTPEPEIYSVVAYAVDEAYYEGDELTKYGIAPTELVLNADRTGKLNLMGSETDIEWTEDGSITAGGQPLYTFIRADADTIVLRVYETEFTLRRSSAQPQSAEASAAPAAQPDGGTAEAGASGEPYGDSDGVIERKKLAALYHWLESMQSEFRSLLTFDEIGAAVGYFASIKEGALIVIERDIAVNDVAGNGTIVDARLSQELLENLFYVGSPLHDGAVVIRRDRIYAAGCVLPLTENTNLGKDLGTRHRAGIGISEVTDAIVIIVSEETGIISMAQEGKISRFLDVRTVEKTLLNYYMTKLPKENDYSLKNVISNIWRKNDESEQNA